VYRALTEVVGRYEAEVERVIASAEKMTKIGTLVMQIIMFTFLLAVIGVPVWKVVYMIRVPVIKITPEMQAAIYLVSTRLLALWLGVDIVVSSLYTLLDIQPPSWYIRLDGFVLMLLGFIGFSVSGNIGLLLFSFFGIATLVLIPIAEKEIMEVTGKSLNEYLETVKSLDVVAEQARKSLEEELQKFMKSL